MPTNQIEEMTRVWLVDTGSTKAEDSIRDMEIMADGDPLVFGDLIVEAGYADDSAMPSDEEMDELAFIAYGDEATGDDPGKYAKWEEEKHPKEK